MTDVSASAWRVVVVEDNAHTRHFLEQCVLAHPRLQLAASFGTLAPARAWFARQGADLLLVDLGLPDGSGLDLMHLVRRHWPACDMLVVSMFGDEENVVASIEAGAVGYVHKDDEATDIAETLLAVKRGASPISPMIARHLLRRMQPRAGDSPPATPRSEPASGPSVPALGVTLSPREQEVLGYIARGFSYAEIARQQGITVHTVQTYIKKLYGKLAVHSRSEAVYEASRLGLLGQLGTRPD
ncbi:response regulator [Aquabacterium fontiphilum]|uniref:response regulator n=1 Tax=Aquabacterium fontiphilum TaxID=450365 RepID=UPI0013778078|nr:response regulator transcription factor [Aquabacterium fontiphilum]NBD19589.1 response regulator [Aquabacterium fontiphilum]